MQDCRAAYESLDPWKVFDACGQLIVDGEHPVDANAWDWLMLARVYVDDTEPNWDNIRSFRTPSLDSGQRTGSKVFDIIERTKDEKSRKGLFAEARAFGPWFNAYAHSREIGDWKAYYKFRKKLNGGKESEPWNQTEMRKNVLALAEAKKWDEALRLSAALIAYESSFEHFNLRGDVHRSAGNPLFAAKNYWLATKLTIEPFTTVYPKYTEACEAFTKKRGNTQPRNLMEFISPLATYVREKGNLEPKFSAAGLRTQWQADGSLRIWKKYVEGFYLLPDGVSFQKALQGGKRGPVESPLETPSGKRMYFFYGRDGLAWFPTGGFYFGLLTPFAKDGDGTYVMADGFDDVDGPFFGGQPKVLVKEVSRVVDYGKTTVTYTDGLVVTTPPQRQARIDVPGSGWFRGDIMGDLLPYTGVLTGDDGVWVLVYEGVLRGSEKIGNAVYLSVDRDSGVKLDPNGDVVYHKQVGDDHTFITWPASGGERLTSMKTIEPDWAAFEAGRRAIAEKEALDEELRAAQSYVPTSKIQACSRCNGTGRVWQSGGASQERVSAPSGSSASQREDFYNSAASVRTTHTSGGMVTCPACNGRGNQ